MSELNVFGCIDNDFGDLSFPEAEAQNLSPATDLVMHKNKVVENLDVIQANDRKFVSLSQLRMGTALQYLPSSI